MAKRTFKVVNQSVPKLDAMPLALGKPLFVADFKPADALYAKFLWSPHAHAIIKDIDISAAEKMPGVHCVLYHGNVPRIAHTTAGQGYPEPSPYDTFMFDHKVRHVGDRVAAVAAETPEIAEAAVKAIRVEYEILKPVLSIEEALQEGSPVIHDEPEARAIIPVPYEPEKNIAAKVGMDVGNVDQAIAGAAYKLDNSYYIHLAQHCPIEPHVALAHVDAEGRLVIRTSTQVPFHARRITAQVLDIPVRMVRVIKPRIGGGFGAKQEVLIEDVVGMLAWRTRRPVLLMYTREEEFVSSRTRHPERIHVRLGADPEGTLTALSMDCISNTGAYGAHALTVVCNSGSKVLPLYRSPNVHFTGTAVYTNLPVGGAYRGYGATQAAFAVESAMDEFAEVIGIDPLVFRMNHHIRSGETSPVFAALGEGKEGVQQSIGSCGLDKCIKLGAKAIGWKKRGDWRKKKGDGSFNLLMGATDLGTGSDTVLAQIAAEAIGTTSDKLLVYSSDTDMTPFDVGAYASSTTYLTGNAVLDAGLKIKKQILGVAAELLEKKPAELEVRDAQVFAKDGSGSVTFQDIALHSLYAANQFQIAAISSNISHKSPPPFAAHFAEVEIDTETGLIRVVKYVAATDCGTAIHPKLAEGQVEGAVMNGICYALTEQYLFNEKGRMTNDSFLNYKIYSMRDKPEMVTILVSTYEKTGPFGAKSVSEIGINGPCPAIANAIYNAVGVRLREAPFTPEKIWRAIQQRGA
jgi:putative selenate reductase molybdopterin-binding subunit